MIYAIFLNVIIVFSPWNIGHSRFLGEFILDFGVILAIPVGYVIKHMESMLISFVQKCMGISLCIDFIEVNMTFDLPGLIFILQNWIFWVFLWDDIKGNHLFLLSNFFF